MRQVQQIMGMPITIDIPSCDTAQTFDWAFARLRQIDEKFSTYKQDSEVSKYIRGEIDEHGASKELKKIIRACRAAQKKTDGFFSAWASGTFDPSGYVKGWAIAEAGEIIKKSGYQTYCIGAGGDILASSDGDKIWSIGIQDPTDKNKILNKLSISNGAVATSGNYERGAHIINPKTHKPADELLSVTITGPDIIQADVLATACFAMGPQSLEFMKSQPNYGILVVDKSGKVHSTI
jgi:FAD:protein FMN transferase